jgi:hypothetical protein
MIGYLLIASAYLCKQSFLFVAPLTVLLLGNWREKKYWLTITLPAAGYFAYLVDYGIPLGGRPADGFADGLLIYRRIELSELWHLARRVGWGTARRFC